MERHLGIDCLWNFIDFWTQVGRKNARIIEPRQAKTGQDKGRQRKGREGRGKEERDRDWKGKRVAGEIPARGGGVHPTFRGRLCLESPPFYLGKSWRLVIVF